MSDIDYRGELGVVLFHFGDTDFQINMGDKIAQPVFERIKTLEILAVNSLEATHWGNKIFDLIGVKTTLESINSITKTQSAFGDNSSKGDELLMNELYQHVKECSHET